MARCFELPDPSTLARRKWQCSEISLSAFAQDDGCFGENRSLTLRMMEVATRWSTDFAGGMQPGRPRWPSAGAMRRIASDRARESRMGAKQIWFMPSPAVAAR